MCCSRNRWRFLLHSNWLLSVARSSHNGCQCIRSSQHNAIYFSFCGWKTLASGKWRLASPGLACIARFPSRVVFYTRVVLILLLVGCDSGEFKTYPVKGTVTFSDGTPLPVGKIYFDTRDEQYGLGVGATGNIKEDGTFELRTYVPGDGAPPGQYIVYIRGALTGGRVSMNVEERQPGMPLIHKNYLNANTTDIRLEVKKEANDFALEVDRP